MLHYQFEVFQKGDLLLLHSYIKNKIASDGYLENYQPKTDQLGKNNGEKNLFLCEKETMDMWSFSSRVKKYLMS